MQATIQLNDGRAVFRPGEPVRGTVRWQSDMPVKDLELRLIYHTGGRGTEDVVTVAVAPFARPGASESRPFELLPCGSHPWSFSGKLVSVMWALELVHDGEALAAQCEIIVSPTGGEIDLYAHDDGSASAGARPGKPGFSR